MNPSTPWKEFQIERAGKCHVRIRMNGKWPEFQEFRESNGTWVNVPKSDKGYYHSMIGKAIAAGMIRHRGYEPTGLMHDDH